MAKSQLGVVPRDVLAALPLEKGEKIIASSRAKTCEDIIASSHALYIAADHHVLRKLWTDIESIQLSKDRTLSIVWATGEQTSTMTLEDTNRKLASTLNERLTTSVVASDLLKLPGGEVKVAIRRAADGRLFSQVVANGPVDLDNAAIVAMVARTEAALREAVGLDG